MPDFYGTATGFRTYHTARGRDVSAYSDDAEVNAAGLVASEWLDAKYATMFPGLKVGQRDQIREWPRIGGYDRYGYLIASSSVPTEVENATYEAQLRELQAPGALVKDYTPPKYESVSIVGAISVKYRRVDGAMDTQLEIPIVGQILAPILTGCNNASSLSGGLSRV